MVLQKAAEVDIERNRTGAVPAAGTGTRVQPAQSWRELRVACDTLTQSHSLSRSAYTLSVLRTPK